MARSSTAFATEKLATMEAFGARLELIESPEGITPTLIPRMRARAAAIDIRLGENIAIATLAGAFSIFSVAIVLEGARSFAGTERIIDLAIGVFTVFISWTTLHVIYAVHYAHIYYDPATRDAAAAVHEQLGARFEVTLGRWHDKPVGPHPQAMYQVAFAADRFAGIVPWLMLNRQGLDVLIHPRTGDAVVDHTDHALWLGHKLELNIEVLRKG